MDQGEGGGAWMAIFAFIWFCSCLDWLLLGGGGALLQKRRRDAGRRARCDVVPVYRFVLCTSVSVVSSPRVCLRYQGKSTLLGGIVMGCGQTAGWFQPREELCACWNEWAAVGDGSAEGSRLRITNCTMIALTVKKDPV